MVLGFFFFFSEPGDGQPRKADQEHVARPVPEPRPPEQVAHAEQGPPRQQDAPLGPGGQARKVDRPSQVREARGEEGGAEGEGAEARRRGEEEAGGRGRP